MVASMAKRIAEVKEAQRQVDLTAEEVAIVADGLQGILKLYQAGAEEVRPPPPDASLVGGVLISLRGLIFADANRI